MGKFSMSRFFGMDDNYEEDAEASQDTQQQAADESIAHDLHQRHNDNKVVSLNAPRAAASQSSKISLFEPRLYADVQDIAKQLLNQQAVIVNFGRIDDDNARRIVDFLTGTVFAIDGDIERIGDAIFLCTPKNFEITGDLSATLGKKLK
ncbi:cell division protein SepF [Secundilactobacillus pentosiphilus]|uniref:Cell division protein SepF n=1 Tax=Secundilactobacillus pentosiphilus TaxID=1714682 RepID=A0A1Z5IPU9_9LACO|nr:cell division protein SepF [Secundilactobacillus pentosiphilus]GAX03602.1 cell division protein SepF [Secundilactobacillus pentosiphilus]GAX05561.1 cell division protein SepF [Secundilactobacillus pentosiphilus]